MRKGLAAASRVDLVPAAWDAALAHAIVAEVGHAGLRLIARASMCESMRGPLLGSLTEGVLRLFGAKPDRFFRWANRAWSHVTTGCGNLELEAVEGPMATLVLVEMPTSLAAPEYLQFVAGAMESIFEICNVAGEVEVQPRPDGARFVARWRLEAAGA
jgi:hypothetical protein